MAQGFTQKSETITIEEMAERLSQKLDYDVDGKLIYAGEAVPGSSAASAVWAIKKLIYDGDDQLVETLWAGGNSERINVWNNRASLSYS